MQKQDGQAIQNIPFHGKNQSKDFDAITFNWEKMTSSKLVHMYMTSGDETCYLSKTLCKFLEKSVR